MEWRVFFKYKNKTYRAFKIKQERNLDLIIIPKNTLCISQKLIEDSKIGDQIAVDQNELEIKVDHFTAHATSGEKHVRTIGPLPPFEPKISHNKLSSLTKALPLVTIMATANLGSKESPNKKWFGFSLPDNVNYIIFDIFAFTKNTNLQFRLDMPISNEKKSTEAFDTKIMEMKNCNIAILTRTTDHAFSHFKENVLFQQSEGKSLVITRVESKRILSQVNQISTY